MNTQQEGSCLQAKVVGLRRHHTSHYLDTGLLTSQTVRRLLLFKPHSLAFVTVSWANSYRTVFGPAHIVVQSLSCVRLFATPWTAAHQASLSFTISQSVLRLMSIELMMSSNHLILCCSFPPALNLSQHQDLFQWIDSLHQVAEVLELQLQYQSFQWIFRNDFL